MGKPLKETMLKQDFGISIDCLQSSLRRCTKEQISVGYIAYDSNHCTCVAIAQTGELFLFQIYNLIHQIYSEYI